MKRSRIALLMVLAITLAVPFHSVFGGEQKKVVYIARNLSDQFAAWLASEMEKAAKKYADTYTLEILDSQDNNEKQNALIETAIAKRYDVIIIQPNDGELQRPYAQAVMDAGLFVITTNARIPDLPGSSSVDADPYEQGAALARDAVKRAPKGARTTFMSCLPGNLHTTSRMKAFHEVFLGQRPDAVLLAEVTTERPDEGYYMSIFEDWVQSYGKIDVALCIGDSLAMSCWEVVKDDPRFKDTLFYGES